MSDTANAIPDSAPRTSGLDTVLAVLTERVLALLSAERCTLFIFDPLTSTLWARVATGAGTNTIRIPATSGLVGESFGTASVINIPDAYADPRFNREIDQRTGFRTHTVLCVPMFRPDGTKAGVIQVLNKQGGPFTEHDVELGGVFSTQAAITIQSAIATDALETSRRRERRLTQELSDSHEKLQQAFNELTAQKQSLEKSFTRQRLILIVALSVAGLIIAGLVFRLVKK